MSPDIVSNVRVLEDGLLAIILIAVVIRLTMGAYRLRGVPYGKVPLFLVISLIPFLGWKVLGAIRRIAIVKDSVIYDPLHDFGEALESLSGLALAILFFFIYRQFKKYHY